MTMAKLEKTAPDGLNCALSIIIPCFNSGVYLKEAVESVFDYSGSVTLEVIIVDDGSTDIATLALLESLRHDGVRVIRKKNGGPASARNEGVQNARGEFLLFLDSDNKIRPNMIEDGTRIFSASLDIGVVYGKPCFFGNTTQARFQPRPFDRFEILLGNYIDVCTLVRRQVFEDAGGFDEDARLIGFEDWEFWIRVTQGGWGFRFVEDIWYDYRIRSDSVVVAALNTERYNQMLCYVYLKHQSVYRQSFQDLLQECRFYQADKARPIRSFFKFLYLKYIKRVPAVFGGGDPNKIKTPLAGVRQGERPI